MAGAAVRITDYPRYGYRGVMLDIARHYEPPSAVEQLISQAAAYKIDVLHLHLSDDQGFRIAVNGFPRLTRIGGQGSVGTGGRARDPGGSWTRAQYQAVVADAAAHFVTIVPEVDTPGHNNAIIMSEYNDTGNRLLNGHPQDINCGRNHPPEWDYTEDVGYSALCPQRQHVGDHERHHRQLARCPPAPTTTWAATRCPATCWPAAVRSFVNQEAGIISGRREDRHGLG